MNTVYIVWTHADFIPGNGGTESLVIGYVRELNKRGYKSYLVFLKDRTIYITKDTIPVPYLFLPKAVDLAGLTGEIVLVNNPLEFKKHKKPLLYFTISPTELHTLRMPNPINILKEYNIITLSEYSRRAWANFFHTTTKNIGVVYPFIDTEYTKIRRLHQGKTIKLLFAGRLHPEKGIYTLLEAFYMLLMQPFKIQLTVTNAGSTTAIGEVIHNMLHMHPAIKIIKKKTSPKTMASLYASHSILIAPSNVEAFGMVSIEAQACGIPVIASNVDGLPETQCGLLTLVPPRDPTAIVDAINTLKTGAKAKKADANKFSLATSTDQLLHIISKNL